MSPSLVIDDGQPPTRRQGATGPSVKLENHRTKYILPAESGRQHLWSLGGNYVTLNVASDSYLYSLLVTGEVLLACACCCLVMFMAGVACECVRVRVFFFSFFFFFLLLLRRRLLLLVVAFWCLLRSLSLWPLLVPMRPLRNISTIPRPRKKKLCCHRSPPGSRNFISIENQPHLYFFQQAVDELCIKHLTSFSLIIGKQCCWKSYTL